MSKQSRQTESTRATRLAASDPGVLVDLHRYPLSRLGSPEGARLVAESRSALRETGVCLLPGFLTAESLEAMAADARALQSEAWFFRSAHNAYLEPRDAAFPADHPRRRLLPSSVGSIAYDRLPPESALRRLYEWDPLRDFVGAVMGLPRLFRLADPLGALYVNVYGAGDRDGWHFDEAEYSTNLMLQAPEAGGMHEYVRGLRNNGDIDYEALDRVLDDRSNAVERLVYAPGDLVIYDGRRSLHRVTEVEGNAARLVAVLCYDTRPGQVNSDEVRRMFWGRTQ